MVYARLNVAIIFVTIFFGSVACENDSTQQKSSLFSFLTHPVTLLGSGLASLGLYCACSQKESFEAYSWLKHQFDIVPTLVKCGGAFLVGLGGYCFYRTSSKVNKQKNKINKMRSRVKNLEGLLSVDNNSENITIPAVVFGRYFQKVDNLELIVLGKNTSAASFGKDAPLMPSRIGANEERMEISENILIELRERVSQQQAEMQGWFLKQNECILTAKRDINDIKQTLKKEQGNSPRKKEEGIQIRKPKRRVPMPPPCDDSKTGGD